jgi:hypothetical protein
LRPAGEVQCCFSPFGLTISISITTTIAAAAAAMVNGGFLYVARQKGRGERKGQCARARVCVCVNACNDTLKPQQQQPNHATPYLRQTDVQACHADTPPLNTTAQRTPDNPTLRTSGHNNVLTPYRSTAHSERTNCYTNAATVTATCFFWLTLAAPHRAQQHITGTTSHSKQKNAAIRCHYVTENHSKARHT